MDGDPDFDLDSDFDPDPDMEKDRRTRLRQGLFAATSGFELPFSGRIYLAILIPGRCPGLFSVALV